MFGPTLIVKLALADIAVGFVASVTFTVNAKLPSFVGMPLIAPVWALSVSPWGSCPFWTRQDSGAIPIAAFRVCG